ncbi:MAG: hypothetical protein QGG64_24720 [Candidatus Latescibacteria bacterium]|jgi:hypothetical protein|nr:hypothetical protein [Candidatus Latescibacterota bacterium]
MADQSNGSGGQPESPEEQFKRAVFPSELERVVERQKQAEVDDEGKVKDVLKKHQDPDDTSTYQDRTLN